MRHEANATNLCLALTTMLKSLKKDFEKGIHSGQMAEVYLTETKSLMERLPQLAAEAQEAAHADRDLGDIGSLSVRLRRSSCVLAPGLTARHRKANFGQRYRAL
jgi:hypothetical protein